MSVRIVAACAMTLTVATMVYAQRGAAPRVADARRPQAQAVPNGQVQRGGAPKWFPLDARLQQHTDQVLKYWEHHSGKIDRYRSNFQRWEFDPAFDAKKFATYARGRIQYKNPDKGLFEVTELHQGRKGAGGEIKHIKQKDTDLEKWICDGKTVFEFDHRNLLVIERPLPPDMHGKQIVEGPLPFLFGAEAEQINARYWVRVNPNKRGDNPQQGVFWIEAVPKHRADAADYKQIDVVIPDDKKFLPKAIILRHRDGSRTTFEFSERDHDWNDPFEKLRIWERAFFNPATPRGWKRFKEPFAQPAVVQPQAAPRVTRQPLRSVQPRSTR